MSNSSDVKGFKMLEDAVNKIIKKFPFKFDYSTRGKVISIASDKKSAVIEINDRNKTCYCHPYVGNIINVGEIVSVTFEKGEMDFPRIRL